MDDDGYPSDEDLLKIEEWPYQDFPGLMKFVKSIWWHPDWGWTINGNKYNISTGGWSGNEDIIGALMRNKMFWLLCWVSSRRGGHFEFELRDIKE